MAGDSAAGPGVRFKEDKLMTSRWPTASACRLDQASKQLLSFPNLLPQGGPQLNCVFRERPMLQRIAIAARGARAFGATMHAAAFLARDGWRPTALALPRFGSASRAIEHRAPVARMRTRHQRR